MDWTSSCSFLILAFILLKLKIPFIEIKTAKDGSDFLDKIDIFNPDLVTLDVMMPGPTTSEILEKLKNKKSNPKIILLTVVRYSNEEREKILNMGNIVDYITKPFDFDQLINTIQKHVIKTVTAS